MKKLFIILLISGMAFQGRAQQIPFYQAKDSALHYFLLYSVVLKDTAKSAGDVMATVDRYMYFERQCLAHFKRKKDKEVFLRELVAEAMMATEK